MVSMAGLQVFVVRFFFQGARKGTSYSRIPPKAHDVSMQARTVHRKDENDKERKDKEREDGTRLTIVCRLRMMACDICSVTLGWKCW